MSMAGLGVRLYRQVISLGPRPISAFAEHVRAQGMPRSLKRPRTFSDKLLHRMLFDTSPVLGRYADKSWSKEYAAKLLPGVLHVPTTRFFGEGSGARTYVSRHPSADLVVKPNHLGGGIVLFTRPRPTDDDWSRLFEATERTEKVYLKTMGTPWRLAGRGYLIEDRLRISGDTPLDEFKIHVFAGTSRLVSHYSDRFRGTLVRHYRPDWSCPEIDTKYGVAPRIARPSVLTQMLDAAARLCEGLDYMRVDFYLIDDTLYFSEFAPYPSFGGLRNSPALDEELGAYWTMRKD